MPTDTTSGDQAALVAELTKQVTNLVQAFATMQEASNTNNNASTDAHRLLGLLTARIDAFQFDAEEEKTFNGWYQRYGEIIEKDGKVLADDVKVRLVLSKLSLNDFNHYSNRILPKIPSDMNYKDTISTLKSTFKSSVSIFRRRQDFLRTTFDGNGIEAYTGLVLKWFTTSEFKKMTDDQICCMIWINGIQDPEYQDIRTRALQLLETKPHITLLEMEAEIKRLMDIRADATSVSRLSSNKVS